MNFSFPEHCKIVDASATMVTTNGGVTCDYVSLKNVTKAWIMAKFLQAVSHATVVQPTMATAVAGTGVTNITYSADAWKNADVSSSDTLVRQTAATSHACTAGVTNQIIIVEIDPMQIGSSYDVLGCTISNSSQATNFVDVTYILQTTYPQATPPAAITD